jgi:glycosyltransferase involved in cell wall biosynthesis
MDLPGLTGASFRLAMDVKDAADLATLQRAGWNVFDPLGISLDPDEYRRFICASSGEFTTAKDVNVRLRSGWFSDRSACYLAAGRPVVTQDTGFGDVLPSGEGLLAYRTIEEAARAIQGIVADPDRHRAAARRIAEQHYAAERVLGELVAAL